ncbi:MAG: oligoribonuclease [Candidatus Poseidoniaceae archaeon]
MSNDRMVWIDLEMTGLDINRDRIIEIATLVTDGELNLIAEGPNLAVHVSEEAIAGMDEWNTTHHHRSGLVDRIRAEGVSVEEAQARTLAFLEEHVEPNTAPLCGNSVWNDKRFLEKEMPDIVAFLHYRMIDVSTVKELARRWYPEVPRYEKTGAHLALDDIRESVEELRHFRERVFR